MNELFTKEFDSDSNDDEYIPSKKEIEQSNEEMKNKKKENIKVNKSKVDAIWEKLKQLRNSNNDNINLKNENSNELEKRIVNDVEKEKKLEEEIKEAIKKSKELKQKTVTEKYYFAGQQFEEKKEINEKEVNKKLNIYEPNSSSMKGFYNTNLNKAKKYMFQIVGKFLENIKHQILKKI